MADRVCVIGAGPCGLAQLQAFFRAKQAGAEIPEIVCYERQSDWGGLWNYTWRTGLDEHGEPVHSSMYRYLWSNGPKECLEFADYTFDEHFGQPIPSFPPREVLFNYITGRAEASGVRDLISFNAAVRNVAWDGEKFQVTVEALGAGTRSTEAFDWVVVSTGHFSVPNVPTFDGIESFNGRVLHSHDFRDAREFSGRDIIAVGSSYSAEDIALQCHKYGANSVTVSYRTAPMGFGWPDGIREVPLITRTAGNTVHFADGASAEADAIILCTGYKHTFPFMEDDLKLRTANLLWTSNLYKGVVWEDNPKLFYLGMQDQYYTFTMFDAQAWFARDVILGRIKLPDRDAMRADSAQWQARMEALETPYDDIDYQTDYIRDLVAVTDYPEFDLDLAARLFYNWEHHKDDGILTYRDHGHESTVTGTLGPSHHTPWIEAMDDSQETFMASG